MRVGLLANPTAGKGRAESFHTPVREILSRAGFLVEDLSAPTAALAAAAARQAVQDDTVDALVVVGGDGMVNLGVQACGGTPVPLGVVAAGTGNDSATAHGLPLAPLTAAHQLVDALSDGPRTRGTDLGRVHTADGGQHWFLAVLSLGFDAVVSERGNQMHWPKGPQRYNLAVARELPVFRAPRYELTVDGERQTRRAMLVSFANGPRFGGGMQIAPSASTSDGVGDLVMVGVLPIPEFVKFFPSVFKGTHVRHRAVSITPARRIEVACDRPIIAYADGERLGPLPISAEIVPGALALLT